jgi:hypothetical protein
MKNIILALFVAVIAVTCIGSAEAASFKTQSTTVADDAPTPVIVPGIPKNVNPVCIASGGLTYNDCLLRLQQICSTYHSTTCPGAYCVFGNPVQVVTIPCAAPPEPGQN